MKMLQPRVLKPAALRVSELPDMPTLLGVVKALVGLTRLSEAETRVLKDVVASQDSLARAAIRAEVAAGKDPLGDAYCAIRSPEARRSSGQTFTPDHVVEGMLAWVKRQRKGVKRLVDPGAGRSWTKFSQYRPTGLRWHAW